MTKVKLKTHKSASKRLKLTGTGKVLARHSGGAHRARFKSKRAKQKSTQNQVLVNLGATKLAVFIR
jgi:large subunit ribosomal protein L35